MLTVYMWPRARGGGGLHYHLNDRQGSLALIIRARFKMTNAIHLISRLPDGSGHSSYWTIDKGTATCISQPESCSVEADNQLELCKKLSARPHGEWHGGHDLASFEIKECLLPFGYYMPRVAYCTYPRRDIERTYPPFEFDEFDSMRQFHIFSAELQRILETVYPSDSNLFAFGDRIRNLILLCAMEVEVHLTTIMRENGFKPMGKNWNMGDYVKLDQWTKLSQAEVELTCFGGQSNRKPLADFQPGKTPTWWTAYNKIKHDRIKNMSLGNLSNAVDAFCSLGCLLTLQQSQPVQDKLFKNLTLHRIEVFQVENAPWKSLPMSLL